MFRLVGHAATYRQLDDGCGCHNVRNGPQALQFANFPQPSFCFIIFT